MLAHVAKHIRGLCIQLFNQFFVIPIETYVKPNMFNIGVKINALIKMDTFGGGGVRGLDGRKSTPTGCLTGSGVIFTRGLGGSHLLPWKKNIKTVLGFNF